MTEEEAVRRTVESLRAQGWPEADVREAQYWLERGSPEEEVEPAVRLKRIVAQANLVTFLTGVEPL